MKRLIQGVVGLLTMTFYVGIALGASGSLNLNQPAEMGGVCGSFVVTGTYTLSEDETPTGMGSQEGCPYSYLGVDQLSPAYWDIIQWQPTYARICTEFDGVILGCGKITELGNGSVGYTVLFSSLQPGSSHTVRVYMEDVYGVKCRAAVQWSDPVLVLNGIIAESSATFIACDINDPCCCDPCCGNSCCPPGGGGDGHGAGGGSAGGSGGNGIENPSQ